MQTLGQGTWAVVRRDRGVPGLLGSVARDIRLVWGSWAVGVVFRGMSAFGVVVCLPFFLLFL